MRPSSFWVERSPSAAMDNSYGSSKCGTHTRRARGLGNQARQLSDNSQFTVNSLAESPEAPSSCNARPGAVTNCTSSCRPAVLLGLHDALVGCLDGLRLTYRSHHDVAMISPAHNLVPWSKDCWESS